MGREHAGFESIATGAFLCKIQWFYYRCWHKIGTGSKRMAGPAARVCLYSTSQQHAGTCEINHRSLIGFESKGESPNKKTSVGGIVVVVEPYILLVVSMMIRSMQRRATTHTSTHVRTQRKKGKSLLVYTSGTRV